MTNLKRYEKHYVKRIRLIDIMFCESGQSFCQAITQRKPNF